MEEQTQNGPGSAGNTGTRGLTALGAADMTITDSTGQGLRELAYYFLRQVADEYGQAKRHRDYYAAMAHRAGLTYREIAHEYGVSLSAASQMVKRAEAGAANP